MTFSTLPEARALGAPVVRLFRTALARDPDAAELQASVRRLRDGAALRDVAQDLVGVQGDAPPDAAFVGRILAQAYAGQAQGLERGRTELLAAAALGATRSDLAAILASSPMALEGIPLLPGLCPGAPADDPVAYRIWVEEYDSPTAEALAAIPAMSGTRVSVAMAAGDLTTESALRSLDSLQRQTYQDWELCLAPRLLSAWPRETLDRLAALEPRLRLFPVPPDAARNAGLPHALGGATGPLVCLLEAGDQLAPTALHEVVQEFAAHPGTQMLFTDEDVLHEGTRRAPWFKQAYSPDAMLVGNAVGQLAVYRADLLRQAGGLRPGAAPFEHYDLALRAAALAGVRHVRHLPAVLCHRAAPPRDWPAPAHVPSRPVPGLLSLEAAPFPRARFRLPDPAPLVTVIIPTRDRPALLEACAAGVLGRTDYPALELLLVDNGSTDPAALALLDRLAADRRVRVLRRAGPFNFAALNNAAAAEARGEILVLLNNDVEVTHPDWLRELASHAIRPDVGAVGAKLLYPGGAVQHAGILLGPDAAATHVGRGAAPDAPGYAGQLACARDLSAVTAACLAIRAEVFRAVSGMDERLAVTWNDVDLCLRVRAAGLRVVWTPHAVLLHHESMTRGTEAEDLDKQARFRTEQALVAKTWGDAVEHDPFLNPNLLAGKDGLLVLARPRRRRPWQR